MKSPWLPLGMGVDEQKESKQTEELRNRAAIKVCQNYGHVAKIKNHDKGPLLNSLQYYIGRGGRGLPGLGGGDVQFS